MISYAIQTKLGGRAVNEDSLDVFHSDALSLFTLADGLGGHGSGREASSLAVSQAISVTETCIDADALLAQCFTKAQEAILSQQIKLNLTGAMKTTMVCLHIEDGLARWGHIGDSRVYMFRGRKLLHRTLDHSVPQLLVATGEITESGIRGHEDRNRLVRVLGVEWNSPKYELSPPVPTSEGDAFLLCSDGFWEWIVEKEMLKTFRKAKDPAQWLASMDEIIIRNGAGKNMDNYSAIAVFIRGV